MTEDIKKLDANNIKILYGFFSDSGYEGFMEWFKEQKSERQEYILELMGNMIAELVNAKAEASKVYTVGEKPLAEVLQFKRKPTLTVIK